MQKSCHYQSTLVPIVVWVDQAVQNLRLGGSFLAVDMIRLDSTVAKDYTISLFRRSSLKIVAFLNKGDLMRNYPLVRLHCVPALHNLGRR
jgi:hypothetical protein